MVAVSTQYRFVMEEWSATSLLRTRSVVRSVGAHRRRFPDRAIAGSRSNITPVRKKKKVDHVSRPTLDGKRVCQVQNSTQCEFSDSSNFLSKLHLVILRATHKSHVPKLSLKKKKQKKRYFLYFKKICIVKNQTLDWECFNSKEKIFLLFWILVDFFLRIFIFFTNHLRSAHKAIVNIETVFSSSVLNERQEEMRDHKTHVAVKLRCQVPHTMDAAAHCKQVYLRVKLETDDLWNKSIRDISR